MTSKRSATRSPLWRTPVSAPFVQQLVAVNDQLCFSALQQWEFSQTLASHIRIAPHSVTASVFGSNPFASKTYRQIGDLPSFAREAEQIALKMGIIASVEHLLAYAEDVQGFRQHELGGSILQDDVPEEKMRLNLSDWSSRPITRSWLDTFGYFRLLRNQYAHLYDKPHEVFAGYIRKHGTLLNKFWASRPVDLHGLDFKKLANRSLTPKLTFGVMNVMRVTVQHIDDIFARSFSVEEAIRWSVRDILSRPLNRRLTNERIASKVRMQLTMHWNISVSETVSIREVAALRPTI